MAQATRARTSIAILLVGVMVLSALAAVTAAVPTRAAGAPAPSAVTASVAGIPASPSTAASAAATSLESEITANSAKYAAIVQSLEARGVKPNLIHLPSSEPAGYIDGQLVPGPEYALDTLSPQSQGYSSPPAPSGIAYYGQSGSDVSGSKVATTLDTSSLEGSLNVQNLTSLYLDTDNPDQWGGQLNAVLLNLSLEGADTISSDPVAIWAQNVVSYQSLTDTVSLVDNTWNFTSTSETFPASGTGTVVANDTSDIDYGGELYIGTGPTFYAPAPYSLSLYLNTSLYNPFICTSDSSVYSSSTCSNPTTGAKDYAGDQTLFYNYTFSDSVTDQKASGTFDWLTFHTGKGSVFDPTNTRVAGFEASGGKKGTIGILNDWELDFGIGAYDGANQNVLSANGTATLDYLPDCTKPTSSTPSTCTPSSTHTYQSVPAALNFGSETGETGIGMNIGFTGTTATFNAGPFNLHALWGYSSQAGITAGAVALTNNVQVSGSPLTLTQQPYIFVFFEDTSVATPSATYSWAPDVPVWYLMPGTYKWEALLSDYTEQSGTITLAAGTPQTLTATLPYATSNGVYTPLWAFSNAQLAGISSSGAGTVTSQYLLFDNPTSGTGNPLNTIFNTKDDYDFPSYAGILLSGTTVYVNAHTEPTFYVGSTGLYLQQQLYRTEHVTVSNAADINGWEDMESLLGTPAAQNPIPQANLMIWDSSSDLVYDDNFVAIKAASGYVSPDLLMFYGGTDNVVWGNTFNDPSGVTKSTPGTYAGIAEAEDGDLIYDNNFEVDNPAPFLPWNPYTETGPVSYSDTWNIPEQAASNVAYTINGFALSGNIVGGSQPFQGGNEWWNYGNSLNAYATTPYTNVVDYSDYASIFPPGFGADEAGLRGTGDNVPLPGFALTFTESGLPSGTAWSVTILGVTESSTSTTVSFPGVPDGSYSYKVGLVPGYATTSTGTATVSGAADNVGVAFSAVTYAVSFSESGLPGGTSWSVTLNGNHESSSGTSIAYAEPNGSYSYTVGTVAGYSPSPASGSVTVNGASTSVSVTFTPVEYAVTFSESGLPAEESFQVTLNGVPESLTTNGGTDPLGFGEANGTYAYSIANVPGWSQSTLPATGAVTVDGAAVVEPTLDYSAVEYAVTFSESGLVAGTEWSVTFHGHDGSSTGSSISFSAANGTYSYSVGAVAGYTVSPSSGSVTVSGSDVDVGIAYTVVTYAVTFSESGLPFGETFSVTFDGTPMSATTDGGTDSLDFLAPNGSYAYAIADVSGWHQSTLAYAGTVTVAGSAVEEPTLVYAPVTYAVTFTESGLPGGTEWSVTLDDAMENSVGSSLVFAEPNGTFAYSIGEVPGYAPAASTGSVTVAGAATAASVAFAPVLYTVTFSEAGLPSGETFAVAVNGVPESETTTGAPASLEFSAANGTYAYAIADIAGWSQATLPTSGSLTVDGSSVSEPTLVYSELTYSVEFVETHLPGGTSWSVTLNGSTQSSTGSSIVYAEPNGTFPYSIGAVAGFTADPSAGALVVNGAAVVVPVAFSAVTYSVSFSESGLPGGTGWSVTLDGTTHGSAGTSISFSKPNGTFAYSIGAVAGYFADPSAGSVTVDGAAVSVSIAFSPTTYAVTFTDTGLPGGAMGPTWSVTLNGATESAASGAAIVFREPNGTFDFTVGHVAGYSADPASGSVLVDGAAVDQAIVFAPVPPDMYAVTFTESGLAAGTSWSVTVGSATQSSTGPTIVFELVNGTYEYSVGAVAGYTPTPETGPLTVDGAALAESIAFSPTTYTVTFTETGLPASKWWIAGIGNATLTTTTGGYGAGTTPTSFEFSEPDGTYSYLVASNGAYRVSGVPPNGLLSVGGANVDLSFAFVRGATYTVTVRETGLPSPSAWCFTLGLNACPGSVNPARATHLTPGTYLYDFPSIDGSTPVVKIGGAAVPASGTLVVAHAVSIKVEYTYAVTFSETGLASGALWKVTVAGHTLRSTTTTAVAYLIGGTYTYHISATGYTASPAHDSITVSGASVSVVVTFTPHSHHGSAPSGAEAIARAAPAARSA